MVNADQRPHRDTLFLIECHGASYTSSAGVSAACGDVTQHAVAHTRRRVHARVCTSARHGAPAHWQPHSRASACSLVRFTARRRVACRREAREDVVSVAGIPDRDGDNLETIFQYDSRHVR